MVGLDGGMDVNYMECINNSISPLLRRSSELIIGHVVEPVGLWVVAVGFEVYAVGFLLFGHIISTTSLCKFLGDRCMKDG